MVFRLVIINRVYLFAGKQSESRYRMQESINVILYVFFVLLLSILNITFMGLDLWDNVEQYEKNLSKHQNELYYAPSFKNSVTFTVALSSLAISFIAIGLFLKDRLRKFFRANYAEHSASIAWSIVFVTISIGCVLTWYMIKIFQRENLENLESESLVHDNWDFPLIYLGLVLIGQYCPVGAQVLCIWFAIKGNWNELL